MQILKTKLLTPPLPTQTLLRPRLYEMLKQGLRRRLTVISAGPGWGKSVLLASFFESQRIPHVWYGLDERDRDPVSFLAYLADGMSGEFGGVGGKTQSALQSAGPGGVLPDTLVSILLNEILDALPQEIHVVLDDYRQAHSDKGVNALLLRLVRHAPPNLHLFLLTRERPALDLGRLKIQGEIIELDGEDLRFTGDEIRDLFKANRGANLSPVDAGRLRNHTDGWAMGLRMALETLSEREGREEPIPSLSRTIGPGDALFSYFEEEVFRSLPAGMQEFLTFTSVPDRFTAELCDTLTGALFFQSLAWRKMDRRPQAAAAVLTLTLNHPDRASPGGPSPGPGPTSITATARPGTITTRPCPRKTGTRTRTGSGSGRIFPFRASLPGAWTPSSP